MKELLIILFIGFSICLIFVKKYYTNKIDNLFDIQTKQELKNKYQSNLEEEYANIKQQYEQKEEVLQEKQKKLQKEQQNIINELVILNDKIADLKDKGIDKINQELDEYKQQKYEHLNSNLQEEYNKKKEILKKEMAQAELSNQLQQAQWMKENEQNRATAEKALKELESEISDYKEKRAVINAQILMERELKEKAQFFTINLSDNDKTDLQLIETFKEQLHNKEVLNRAIFDTFIKKPMSEMIKRVLKGQSPSGIYMITNLLTDEVYIGRAVSVDKRWQEHCKSCFNIGTIAHSTLHTRMAKEGIWNFSFQLLEEVPKDKLSEREKYWINFYETKEYGMNERQGG